MPLTQPVPLAPVSESLPVTLDFESLPTAVRAALEKCEELLALRGLDDDSRGTVQLVLAEVLNNIVEHAYGDKAEGCICLSVALDERTLVCTVADRGHPMPELSVPQTTLPDSSGPLESLPEGGFGWFLIRSLTENLVYERRDEVNHLHFQIPVQLK